MSRRSSKYMLLLNAMLQICADACLALHYCKHVFSIMYFLFLNIMFSIGGLFHGDVPLRDSPDPASSWMSAGRSHRWCQVLYHPRLEQTPRARCKWHDGNCVSRALKCSTGFAYY